MCSPPYQTPSPRCVSWLTSRHPPSSFFHGRRFPAFGGVGQREGAQHGINRIQGFAKYALFLWRHLGEQKKVVDIDIDGRDRRVTLVPGRCPESGRCTGARGDTTGMWWGC